MNIKNKNNVLISIIIPMYNSEKYIYKCIQSVLNQTISEIEVICVDNGSTDSTVSIVDELSVEDTRIKRLFCKKSGVSFARNMGIENANGTYIIFVDSDDWIEPCLCEKFLQRDLYDVVMCTYVREFQNYSLPKKIYNDDRAFYSKKECEELRRKFVGCIGQELAQPENADALCTIWGKLYKRSIIQQHNIKFVDINLIGCYEDGLFNLEYYKYIKNALFLNECLYHYRKDNETSITSKYRKNFIEQRRKLYQYLLQVIHDEKLDDVYLNALNNRVVLEVIGIGLNIFCDDSSWKSKWNELKQYVYSQEYQNAIKDFDFSMMPFKWKVFFFFVKMKMLCGVYMLLYIMKMIRK